VNRTRVLTRIGIAVLLGAVIGCSSGGGASSPSATPSPSAGVAALDRAIESINASRGPLVTAMNAIVVAANRVDAVDVVTVKGDWKAAQKARAANVVDVPAVMDMVGRLPARVRAYTAALNELAAAANAKRVPPRPAEAVRQVVAVGRAEAAADDGFVRAVVVAWPAYAVLSGLQSLWYERAASGWYDSTKLAAQEYAVLTDHNRATTTRASQLFATTDQPRRDAADVWAETLQQIEPVLHPPKRA
jgi:hypothetical protein